MQVQSTEIFIIDEVSVVAGFFFLLIQAFSTPQLNVNSKPKMACKFENQIPNLCKFKTQITNVNLKPKFQMYKCIFVEEKVLLNIVV